MKLAVITPIGPGHEQAYETCKKSIEAAWKHHRGPFDTIEILSLWDLNGEFGRSQRRNEGIREAKRLNCEWIFFIDADDVMTEFAIEDAAPNFEKYDAFWGMICEAPHNDNQKMMLRPNQLGPTELLSDLLKTDPYLSIQMGHFVKTNCAEKVGFDESMDSGEDFKYYLATWSDYRCCKTSSIYFLNVRGNHSTGIRSANGAQWRENVSKQIELKKKNQNANNFTHKEDSLELLLPQVPTALIVAHPDDEVLWAGGLLSRHKGFDIICCSIPKRDPERVLGFFNAAKKLGHHPFLLPYSEIDAESELRNLHLIDLSKYKIIFTHNEQGEYGHKHHMQVHNFVKNNHKGLSYFFGFGKGNYKIKLSPDEQKMKMEALKCYSNKSDSDNGMPKWQALLERYNIETSTESFFCSDSNISVSACGVLTNQEIRSRSDYQVFDISNHSLINVGERLQKKLNALSPVLPSFQEKTVLDIGCDFGFWSFLAAINGGSVVGLDRSRPVKNMGQVNIPLLNNQTAQENKLNAKFLDYEAGNQWWDFKKFDIVFCMSVYHHIFNICKSHQAVWYWFSRICGGQLIWENPLNSDDRVVQINIPNSELDLYNEDAIRSAADLYFSIEYEGPAIHETTRTVWRMTPKENRTFEYSGKSISGAGGASKAFVYDENKRANLISYILGKPIFPGTLNIQLNSDFAWDINYFRAQLPDVKDRAKGIDSDWSLRWVRFYPILINGISAWGMRFEGERYPLNFLEVIASVRLRDSIDGQIELTQ